MSSARQSCLALGFALATLLSAFLVFQVQPVVSKAILPWFGGAPTVWTTCMLFFQVTLFAGYAYAHVLTSRCAPRWQGLVHTGLLAAALLALPIIPAETWKPAGTENPTWRILATLAACVGLPYFLLSSTGPLLQAWFSRVCAGLSPYRLYALSNVGSLAALVTFPFLVEPNWTTHGQAVMWSGLFCGFAVMASLLAATLRGSSASPLATQQDAEPEATPPSFGRQLAWLLLPAFASVMLLATTNHLCQDVAVVPFLWIAPLGLYLLTFIICFDRECWYRRRWFAGVAALGILGLQISGCTDAVIPLGRELVLNLTVLFCVAMVCHGELVRCKPSPRYLTKFYLLTSAGGALGGLIVGLLCPRLFVSYFEMELCLAAGLVLTTIVFLLEPGHAFQLRPQRKRIVGLASIAACLFVARPFWEEQKFDIVVAKRNFFGTLAVNHVEAGAASSYSLVHGRIVHGLQFRHEKLRQEPTTYYGPKSGAGLTLRFLRPNQPQRVGMVGLGCGTLATYGRKGDTFEFYEIDPDVIDIARRQFTFLDDSQAAVKVHVGDARLTLGRAEPQSFDVLVLDAFSGDSIPTHLLTKEAFADYRRHLRPDGVIAVHISNHHLSLDPVILRQAEELRMTCVKIVNAADPVLPILLSEWMLLTNNAEFLACPEIKPIAIRFRKAADHDFPLWTDQYNNLFQILKGSHG